MVDEHLGERRDVERRRDPAFVLQALEQRLEAARARRCRPMRKISPTRGLRVDFEADLDAHQALVRRLLDEVVLGRAWLSAASKSGAAASAAKRSANSARSRSADAGDQRFLAVEIDIERARADRRPPCRCPAWSCGGSRPRAKHSSAASRMCSRRARWVSGFRRGIGRIPAGSQRGRAAVRNKKRMIVLFVTFAAGCKEAPPPHPGAEPAGDRVW